MNYLSLITYLDEFRGCYFDDRDNPDLIVIAFDSEKGKNRRRIQDIKLMLLCLGYTGVQVEYSANKQTIWITVQGSYWHFDTKVNEELDTEETTDPINIEE